MGAVKEPKTRGNRGPMSALTKKKKLNQYIDIVESGNYSKLRDIDIARELKITRVTLNSFKKQIGDKISKPNLDLIRIDLLANYNKLRRRLNTISEKIELISNDELNRGPEKPEYIYAELRVLKEIRETIKDYVKILEDFGIKEKVSEKIDLTANIKTTNTQINYFTQNNIVMALDENLNDKLNEEDKQKLILDIMSKNEISNESDIQS